MSLNTRSLGVFVLGMLTSVAFMGCMPAPGGTNDDPIVGGVIEPGEDPFLPGGGTGGEDPNSGQSGNDEPSEPSTPEVYFKVIPITGARPLTVTCSAFTMTGEALPEGEYIWSFDGQEERGPVSTHGERTHVFQTSGPHIIKLSIALVGLTSPISCVCKQNNTQEGYAIVYPRISGTVRDPQGNGVPGIVVSADCYKATDVTDADGRYEIDVFYAWSGTVVPQHNGYTFNLPERRYTKLEVDAANQNFTATPIAPAQIAVSGHVRDDAANPISGVVLAASGDAGTATTDAQGFYEFTFEEGWSGTITPSHAEYTFSPTDCSVTNLTSALSGQDFTASSLPSDCSIAGRLLDSEGVELHLADVQFSATGGLVTVSEADGSYFLPVTEGWTGTITPSLDGYTFEPASVTYGNEPGCDEPAVTTDVVNADFVVIVDEPVGDCVTSSETWQNTQIDPQTGVFTVEFDAIPNGASIDGLTALSMGESTTWSDCAVIVRFNDSDMIDARNGGSYAADAALAYTADESYHFRLTVNVPAHTYSVFVTPEGSTEVTIAEDFAFRTEQSGVAQLDHWSLQASIGSHQVCDLTVETSGNQPPIADAGSDQAVTDTDESGTEQVTLNGSASNDTDGTITNYRWAEGATVLYDGPDPTADVELAVGTHSITLTVTDNDGATDTDTMTADVLAGGGEVLIPIARWDVVPYQRVNAGETFKAGVVAFSKNGIEKVSVSVSGQGYTGPSPLEATEMTYNDRTDVWEYWVPINADDFSSDGPITLEATVHGKDGGIRDKNTHGGGWGLDALTLHVNPNGTLPQPKAWVAVDGDDDNDGTEGSPVATIGRAMSILSAANGGVADGGIVYLGPGEHQINGLSNGPTSTEWVTITRSAAGTKENTKITSSGGGGLTTLLKISGITLENSPEHVLLIYGHLDDGTSAWIHDSRLIGFDRHIQGTKPVSGFIVNRYFTDTYIYNTSGGCPGYLDKSHAWIARGLTIEHIGNDAFKNAVMVVNCTANDLDPGSTGWHSDAWQWHGGEGDSNLIIYGYRATNLHYQGIYIRSGDNSDPENRAQGVAIVNCYFEKAPDVDPEFTTQSSWERQVDHFVFWHNTHLMDRFVYGHDSQDQVRDTPNTGVSAKGNLFREFRRYWGEEGQYDDPPGAWQQNHFEIANDPPRAIPLGTDYTTGGAMVDGNGVPQNPDLHERVTGLHVPVDASGVERSSPSTIGAMEFVDQP